MISGRAVTSGRVGARTAVVLVRPVAGRRRGPFGGTMHGVINNGIATIFVADLDRSVAFYTEILGLRLGYQADGHWASVFAGGFEIGLHPAGRGGPPPGAAGAVTVGLSVDDPIDVVVRTLQARGVPFRGSIVDDGPVKLAFFADPDGNELYLAEQPAARTE